MQRGPLRGLVEERAVLQTEQQADAARGGLRPELAARVGFLVDELQDHAEQLGARVALRETERDRTLRAAVDLGHPVDLGARAFVVGAGSLETRCDFVDALAVPAEHVGDREQLALVGPRARHHAPVGDAVQQRARGREAQRAGAHRLVDQIGHHRDVVVGGRLLAEAPFAHGVVPQRAVADHPADVDALRHAVDRAEVLAVGLPVPREPFEDARGRDVLHRLHQRGEPRLVAPAHRRERHAAVAEHDRGHAVPARRRRVGVPRELGVEVGVDVDEARRHERAVGVDGAPGRVVDPADLGDAFAVDRDVAGEGRAAGAVDERATADDEIVCHGRKLRRDRRAVW